jgi:hypothetical protein
MKLITALALVLFMPSVLLAQPDPRLAKATRQEKAGWIYIHLEGSPRQIGYQHGYLLAPEIADSLRVMKAFLAKTSGKDWEFYRKTSIRLFWPRLGGEYRDEIAGIAEGAQARGVKVDAYDITVLNGWVEVAWYYIPYLAEMQKKHKSAAKDYCSAFIANGSYTADGKIVMGHNTWLDYVVGERWNVVADIVPAKGHRMLMDTSPGLIHSGDDFVITKGGLLITETTIGGFMGYNEKGTPEFVRARRAAQYANNIEDFARIMTADNSGGYANSWLVGDTKTNEIARLDLGLKNHKVERSKDGILFGANYPSDQKLMREETAFNPKDPVNTSNGRKVRWEALGKDDRGTFDAEVAKRILGDHVDTYKKRAAPSCRTLCGHLDVDPHGVPEGGWGPYYPAGAVQAKVTTTELAGKMQFWARMGHPCGEDFKAGAYLKQHKEFGWLSPYLKDMKSYPWALFTAKR